MQFEEYEQQQPTESIYDDGDENMIAEFHDCTEFSSQTNHLNRNYTIYFDGNCNDSDEYFQSNKTTRMFKKCVSMYNILICLNIR